MRTHPPMRAPMIVLALLLVLVSLGGRADASVMTATRASSIVEGADPAPDAVHPRWDWPLEGPRDVTSPYRAPAHEYGAGHRGIDAMTSVGAEVSAPAEGRVAFRGSVVDRPLLTIDHPGGYVSTFEPLISTWQPGDAVTAGDVIGTVAVGGHAVAGTLHLGVRSHGAYIDPLLLFGPVPRAVLLPCCDGS